MKYLKKINETYKEENVVKYIEQCFISFLDNGESFNTETYGIGQNIRMVMLIDISEQIDTDINGLLEFSDNLHTTSLEINDCINKAKIEYPDAEYYTEIIRTLQGSHGASDNELYLTIKVELIFRN